MPAAAIPACGTPPGAVAAWREVVRQGGAHRSGMGLAREHLQRDASAALARGIPPTAGPDRAALRATCRRCRNTVMLVAAAEPGGATGAADPRTARAVCLRPGDRPIMPCPVGHSTRSPTTAHVPGLQPSAAARHGQRPIVVPTGPRNHHSVLDIRITRRSDAPSPVPAGSVTRSRYLPPSEPRQITARARRAKGKYGRNVAGKRGWPVPCWAARATILCTRPFCFHMRIRCCRSE